MKKELENLKKEILGKLAEVKDSEYLRKLEIKYFGRRGELNKILRGIKNLGTEEKKELGRLANETKAELQARLLEARNVLSGRSGRGDFLDVTLPGEKIRAGHLHPLTLIQNELEDLFSALGFMILDGPELESEYYNFEALNIPAYHPARDMQDTFYVETQMATNNSQIATNVEQIATKAREGLVMRTHTSPVQVRAMQKYGAPLRCVVPGRVFRCEATDATHEHTINQIEGLMIDKNISLANLISVLTGMLSGIFDQEVKLRIRPGYFPFVEPGLEVDMSCTICGGKSCPSCKHTGWLEMLGAGLVHPRVLEAGGINPKEYSGFAFGLGIDRLAMMKYGINDIRLFNSGDLRFLSQF